MVYNETVAGAVSRADAGDAMSELLDARHMLDLAEHAAIAGDLASADELLRGAARIQAAELGPLHSDLANTLNNLAIVAEKAGRPNEAETFYRRATAIASASLPADHPMIAASRQNLEDFCLAQGLPIDAPIIITPSELDTELGLDVFAREDAAGAAKTPTDVQAADVDVRAADVDLTARATPPPSDTASPVLHPPTSPVLHPPTAAASRSVPPAPRRASRVFAWVAIGVAALGTGAFLGAQPWSLLETLALAPTAPTAPRAAAPAPPPRAAPSAKSAPIEQAPQPNVVPRSDDRRVATDTPPAAASSSNAVTLAEAQLCQTFSTSGGRWRCDPADDSVAPGPLVLYTRVRSPRDIAVVHQWYRGDTLRKSVKLSIRASATEGYRTYSRHTVDGGGDWRVEVMSEGGDLLHEQRFAVR